MHDASSPIPPQAEARILDALHEAYERSQEVHAEDFGHTELNFGISVWTTGNHSLQLYLEGIAAPAVVRNSLELRMFGYRFHHHKLGFSERDDPWLSLPNHPGPAGRITPDGFDPLTLPMPGMPKSMVWVIGHYGNSREGLRAVRLQRVERTEHGKVKEWGAVVTLWEADGLSIAAAGDEAYEPPAVEIDEPDIAIAEEEAEEEDQ